METIKSIEQWTVDTFKKPSSAEVFLKLAEEVGELAIAVQDGSYFKLMEEAADCLIVLCHLAGRYGDFEAAVHNKMKVNRMRTWQQTSVGTYRHV